MSTEGNFRRNVVNLREGALSSRRNGFIKGVIDSPVAAIPVTSVVSFSTHLPPAHIESSFSSISNNSQFGESFEESYQESCKLCKWFIVSIQQNIT